MDLGTASKRVVKLGEYLDFSDAEMNKGYCRSLHTFEWFPDINAELRFPVTMLVRDCTPRVCMRHAVQDKCGQQRELLTNAMRVWAGQVGEPDELSVAAVAAGDCLSRGMGSLV